MFIKPSFSCPLNIFYTRISTPFFIPLTPLFCLFHKTNSLYYYY